MQAAGTHAYAHTHTRCGTCACTQTPAHPCMRGRARRHSSTASQRHSHIETHGCRDTGTLGHSETMKQTQT
eukprot:1507862-Alexandrium_andersonii.AAC.1